LKRFFFSEKSATFYLSYVTASILGFSSDGRSPPPQFAGVSLLFFFHPRITKKNLSPPLRRPRTHPGDSFDGRAAVLGPFFVSPQDGSSPTFSFFVFSRSDRGDRFLLFPTVHARAHDPYPFLGSFCLAWVSEVHAFPPTKHPPPPKPKQTPPPLRNPFPSLPP